MISCNSGEMVGSISRGGIGIIQQAVVHDRERIRALKRRLAGKHFVEHDAQRVDVAARIAALALHLLGRNVFRRAHYLRKLGECQPARAGLAGDAEIDQLDVSSGSTMMFSGFRSRCTMPWVWM